jgi:hypothetical protein
VRRHRAEEINDNSHDAFLDIVANLVGILVILIMVVGVRARHAWQTQQAPERPFVVVEAEPEPQVDEQELDQLQADIQAIEQQTELLYADAHVLDDKAQTIALATAMKAEERNQLQLLVSAIESEIQVQRAQLDEQEQTTFDMAQRIATTENELNDTKSKVHAVSLETLAPTELTHHPTPLAKTVFGQEEHFRMLRGRVVRVPLSELVERLRGDAQSKLWKMKEADEITESLSPIDGFRMKYTMKRIERFIPTPNGRVRKRSIELDRFTLYSVADNLGEPLSAALHPSSTLQRQLAGLSTDDTTITVWTYPDSYTEFRKLQEHLIERGFQVAARPLPTGHPIGGSPSGNRSAAQ